MKIKIGMGMSTFFEISILLLFIYMIIVSFYWAITLESIFFVNNIFNRIYAVGLGILLIICTFIKDD